MISFSSFIKFQSGTKVQVVKVFTGYVLGVLSVCGTIVSSLFLHLSRYSALKPKGRPTVHAVVMEIFHPGLKWRTS